MEKPGKSCEKSDMSLMDRIKYAKSLITVEPIFVFYKIGVLITSPATHNLELEKSCKVVCQYNDTVCEAILAGNTDSYAEELMNVQLPISQMHAWNQPIQCIVPITLILFLGSYSDRRHIRKPFVLLPILAEFIAAIGLILNVIYIREWSLATLGICLSLIPSICGDYIMLEIAVYSYIADVSTEKDRTMRMGMLLIAMNVCHPLMQSFNAHLYSLIGYIPCYCVSVIIFAYAIYYGLVYVKEPRPPVPRDPNVGFFMDLFDPRHVIETLKLPFKKSAENNRLCIFAVILLMIICTGQIVGEYNIMFLFMNFVFGYTVIEFTYYLFFLNLIYLKGSIISVPLFNTWWNLGDYMIIVICLIGKLISNIVMAATTIPLVFFIGSYLGMFSTVMTIALRSLGTKIVNTEDIGKAQSVFGICEALGPALMIPVYNRLIYMKTIDTFPGAFLLAALILDPLCILLVLFLQFQSRRKVAKSIELNTTNKKTVNEADNNQESNEMENNIINNYP